jgi:hypothetical protein
VRPRRSGREGFGSYRRKRHPFPVEALVLARERHATLHVIERLADPVARKIFPDQRFQPGALLVA